MLLTLQSEQSELAEMPFSSNCASLCKCVHSEPVSQTFGAGHWMLIQSTPLKRTSFKHTLRLCAHVSCGPISSTAKWWDISFG